MIKKERKFKGELKIIKCYVRGQTELCLSPIRRPASKQFALSFYRYLSNALSLSSPLP